MAITLPFAHYLVGGAVRDELLGKSVEDRDWVVIGATPEEMLQLGFHTVGKDFPVFLHPETKDEYALARTERKAGRGHTGFVVFADPDVTLEEDLVRRDLTINAIAKEEDGSLVDPFGGARDIANRTLRHVSDAFCEDPLRVFRVARLAAQLDGFSVADETLALMRTMCRAGELSTLTAERVWAELRKALNTQHPARFVEVLEECGGMSDWFPELAGRRQHFNQGEDEHANFVAFFAPATDASALCQRLKVPRAFAQCLADWTAWGELMRSWPHADAQSLYQAFVQLKAAHGLSRLDQLIAVTPGIPEQTRLREIAQGFADVTLAESALTGRAYGEALKRAREAWLGQALLR